MKILQVGEASHSLTGFGTYSREILSRLHKMNIFTIAEMAGYATIDDNKDGHVKWRYYPMAVSPTDPRYKEYKSRPTNQFGEWRFEQVLLDFQPDVVCTPPGELVYTDTGYVAIELIKLGTKVLTHTGNFRKVTKLYKQEYNGKLYSIYFHGCKEPLRLTPEHPVFIYKKRKPTNQKHTKAKIYADAQGVFVAAKNVCEGDIVLLAPHKPFRTQSTIIDITQYLTNFVTVNNNSVKPALHNNDSVVNKHIETNKDFGTLLGYIYSDGCIGPRHITITFGEFEKRFASDAIELFSKIFGLTAIQTPDTDKHCINVQCCSVLVSEFIKKYSLIHEHVNVEFLEGVLRGWVRGDGCYKNNTVSISTVNKVFAHNLRMLCAAIGIETSLQKRICNTSYSTTPITTYDVEAYGLSAVALHAIANKHETLERQESKCLHGKRVQFINGYLTSSVRRTRTSSYNGQVYNIEVDKDNSYTLQQACVHNCDWRDYHMMAFEAISPYRDFYHWVAMPTVDSIPQRDEWIDTYMSADGVFVYSEWAMDELNKQSDNRIKLQRTASPGVDLEIFAPAINKKQHRIEMGIDPSWNILGVVMRNQVRKLYPDLFHAFRLFLNQAPKELAEKTYLYIHTSYPDMKGWDIPGLLKEYDLGNKVLFSYVCKETTQVFCSFFQGARLYSPFSNSMTGVMPNTSVGMSYQEMANIYKTFDLYIQYANCLGKDEEILTISGWKKISEIQLGEFVYTHNKNWKQVQNIFKNKYQGDMYEIVVSGDYETLKVTGGHPVYGYTRHSLANHDKKRNVRELLSNAIKAKEQPSPDFWNADSLQNGDLVLFPIDDFVESVDKIDLAQYAKKCDTVDKKTISIKYGNTYDRYIYISETFCRFIGLFAADGGANPNIVKITSHINETENIELAQQVFGNNYSTRRYKDRKAIDIYKSSRLWFTAFRDWFYTQDKEKQLPTFVMHLDIGLQKQIIQGLFMGDGCYFEPKNVSSYTTVSRKLADQLKILLRRCRLNFNVGIRIKDGNRKPQYCFEVSGNIKNGEFDRATRTTSTHNCYIDNYHAMRVKSVEQIEYNHPYVYNIDVKDDHSYVGKTCSVKNCEGFGMPAVEAAACGIPIMSVDYSAMSDVVRNTKGILLRVQRMYLSINEGAYRAHPDNEYCAKQILKFFQMSKEERQKMSDNARKGAETYYNWDNTAQVWADYFMSIKRTGRQGKWKASETPPNIYPVPTNMPTGLSNSEFVKWICEVVLRQPKLQYTIMGLNMLRDLNYGLKMGANMVTSQEDMAKTLINAAKVNMECEAARCGLIDLAKPDFIEYAHLKERLDNESS